MENSQASRKRISLQSQYKLTSWSTPIGPFSREEPDHIVIDDKTRVNHRVLKTSYLCGV